MTPVIVGVGQYTDRLESPQYRGFSSVELAVEAASRACRDALDDPRVVAQIDGIGALRTFEDSIPRYSTPFGKSDNFPHSIARVVSFISLGTAGSARVSRGGPVSSIRSAPS